MGPRGTAALVAALAVAPLPGRAAPSEAPRREYELGIVERDAGNFVAAADHFDQAYRTLPAEEIEVRAAVLFDLVDARRNAFAEGEGPPQICEAERLLVAYLDEVKRAFGAKGDRRPDTRKAKKLLATVKQDLGVLRREAPALDCAREVIERPGPQPDPDPTTGPEPGPAVEAVPKDTQKDLRARRLIVAGAATTGAGGLFLIMMAAGLGVGAGAEREGAARVSAALSAGMPLSESDPELQAIVRRGHVGNGVAIAGGVVAGASIAAGVVMLVLGKKRSAAPRAALAPGPGLLGGGLALNF